jgi:hypothetical protein
MQIRGPDRFAKSLAQSVKKIEDQRLFDLNLLLRSFQSPNTSSLSQKGEDPQRKADNQQRY